MLNYLKEDAENKYYGVLVGLPIRSMNQNVYRERDLIAASLTLKGKHPSLNHKDSFWFNEQSRWGTLTIEDAKYEDGAIEAVLKVPKTAVCPICNGAKMTELIDQQHIVNVSLEGSMEGAFEFTDPPFTLLTSDVLPGIPLARIKPLEKIMESIIGTKPGVKRMKIEAKVKEDKPQYPKPNVKTDTYTSDEPVTSITTPIAQDSQIDMQADLAKAVVGVNPAGEGTIMKSGDPMTDKMVGSNTGTVETVSEPFAGYTNFADCVAKNSGKDDPDAYCGSIKHQVEDEKLTREEDTSQPKPEDIRTGPTKSKPPEFAIPDVGGLPHTPDYAKVVTGTAPFESLPTLEAIRAQIKAEKRADDATKTAETRVKIAEDNAKLWEAKFSEVYKTHEQLIGAYNQVELETRHAREQREEAIREMHNADVDRDKHIRLFNEEAGTRRKLERQLQETIEALNEKSRKYSEGLKVNLELSQKLTSANEDYLEIAKKMEETEEKLTQARTNAKKTLKLRI